MLGKERAIELSQKAHPLRLSHRASDGAIDAQFALAVISALHCTSSSSLCHGPHDADT
jgi:hypothetical protein